MRTTALTLVAILCVVGIGEAADSVCFSPAVASQIVVEIETCRILKEEKTLIEKGNAELEGQIEVLHRIIEAHEQKAEAFEKAEREYADLLKEQKDLCEQAIRDARPGFLEEARKALGFLGLGILIGFLFL